MRHKFCIAYGSNPLGGGGTMVRMTFEPPSLTTYEIGITIEEHTTFLVRFTMLWPRHHINLNFVHLKISISSMSTVHEWAVKWPYSTMDASTLREVGQLWALPTQCPGRFLGIIGRGSSVPKSQPVTCCDLLVFLYQFEAQSTTSSIKNDG
jgi:hypothetical protein